MNPQDRVQVPAYTDAWMSGDRYGTVVRAPHHIMRGDTLYVDVKLDVSGRVQKFAADDLTNYGPMQSC